MGSPPVWLFRHLTAILMSACGHQPLTKTGKAAVYTNWIILALLSSLCLLSMYGWYVSCRLYTTTLGGLVWYCPALEYKTCLPIDISLILSNFSGYGYRTYTHRMHTCSRHYPYRKGHKRQKIQPNCVWDWPIGKSSVCSARPFNLSGLCCDSDGRNSSAEGIDPIPVDFWDRYLFDVTLCWKNLFHWLL